MPVAAAEAQARLIALIGTAGRLRRQQQDFAAAAAGAFRPRERAGAPNIVLAASGVICLLALQAAVNIGVTTSLLPNKGLPLPFISYGGSNLVACLFCVGLLLNIYRQAVLEPVNKSRTSLQVRVTPRI